MKMKKIKEFLQDYDCQGTFFGQQLLEFDKEDLCKIINYLDQSCRKDREQHIKDLDLMSCMVRGK